MEQFWKHFPPKAVWHFIKRYRARTTICLLINLPEFPSRIIMNMISTSKASLSHSSNKGVKHCQTGINLDVCHSNDSMQRLHQSKLQSRCMTHFKIASINVAVRSMGLVLSYPAHWGFGHVGDHPQHPWFDQRCARIVFHLGWVAGKNFLCCHLHTLRCHTQQKKILIIKNMAPARND